MLSERKRRKYARKISTIVEIRRRRLGLVMGMPKSLFLLLAFLLLSPRHVSVFYCSEFCLSPPRQHITTPRFLVRAAAATAASTTQAARDAATGSSLSSSSAEAVAPNITNATPQQSPSTRPRRRPTTFATLNRRLCILLTDPLHRSPCGSLSQGCSIRTHGADRQPNRSSPR